MLAKAKVNLKRAGVDNDDLQYIDGLGTSTWGQFYVDALAREEV